MGCLVRALGRILFVTMIASSAYLHLNKPQNSIDEAKTNYAHMFECVNQLAPGILPAAQTINWLLIVKIFGLFEALSAILIVFGDVLGGLFFFVALVFEGYFIYHPHILNIVQWEVKNQLQFARYLFFVGASLTMICKKFSKKGSHYQKSC